jgi:hypothetical protein
MKKPENANANVIASRCVPDILGKGRSGIPVGISLA